MTLTEPTAFNHWPLKKSVASIVTIVTLIAGKVKFILSENGIAVLVNTGVICSGSSRVLEILKIPEIGVKAGEASCVAVTVLVVWKSKKMLATRSEVPALAT